KEDLQAYTEAFNTLQVRALSPEDSLDYLAGMGAGA
ncbi:transcriptional regulator, partial [Streptomyces sp. 12257]|nr:transcriptional regulator [Streptomyces sp. 12257]